MAIFDKQQNPQHSEAFELRIPAKSTFSGDILTMSGARIDGVVEGNVSSEQGNVLLGPESKLKGNLAGRDIAVGGAVVGDINCAGQLSVFAGAQVVGNIAALSLVVEKGAVFSGNVSIGEIKAEHEGGRQNDDLMFLTLGGQVDEQDPLKGQQKPWIK
ncbi:polymer-forming cytoskeletal protein [Eubacteriales bacterium OttesenSCG-928-K08]|nr:polymer-forming cytoskeletal protein [Eubacteriales bacterium OttesenSCG-928-K08]